MRGRYGGLRKLLLDGFMADAVIACHSDAVVLLLGAWPLQWLAQVGPARPHGWLQCNQLHIQALVRGTPTDCHSNAVITGVATVASAIVLVGAWPLRRPAQVAP
jgi:hypothetical protein